MANKERIFFLQFLSSGYCAKDQVDDCVVPEGQVRDGSYGRWRVMNSYCNSDSKRKVYCKNEIGKCQRR